VANDTFTTDDRGLVSYLALRGIKHTRAQLVGGRVYFTFSNFNNHEDVLAYYQGRAAVPAVAMMRALEETWSVINETRGMEVRHGR